MITLITRKEIIKTKKIIGSEIAKMQKAFFDEDTLEYYKEDNEEHLYLEYFDFLDEEIIEYVSNYKIIGLNHHEIKTFTKFLTNKLKEIFQVLNVKDFIIISHLKLDIFGNRGNKYKPLVNSYLKFEKMVGLNTYKEAFIFNLESLSDFIEILFWITRCDASVAEFIFLFDKDEKIQIHLCKYGNIHLTEFGKKILTNKKLTSLGWKIIKGREFDNFSDGKIKGRMSI